MKAIVKVDGEILRDKENPAKRNYVNLLISILIDGKATHIYHLTNYAANSSSLKHVLQVKAYTDYIESQRAYNEKRKAKLGRDRDVNKVLHIEYDPLDEKQMKQLADLLSGTEMKVEIAKAKSLVLGVVERVKFIVKEKVETKKREEDELTEIASLATGETYGKAVSDDTLLEMESKTTFGKETAKSNKNWGMF